ncbi:LIC_12616 family protein [Bombella sp. ESL0378]|uniref:phage neck terminator protein n=1 Tax=Bombella sp. ESL0378 TaxID=2676442 RepID=UPI0018C34854|nr:hypothetical protein [Bombella sp. ESL0378]
MVPPDSHTPDPTEVTTQLIPTESTIMHMVGDWLTEVALPADWALIQGQQNRLPPPAQRFMVMQTITRRPLATNRHVYGHTTTTITQPVELAIQLTAYGDDAITTLGTISTLWRDPAAVSWFQQKRDDMAPLNTGSIMQHSFITAEQQYEDSATLTLLLIIQTRLCRSAETALALSMSSIREVDLPSQPLSPIS